jgi:hypothetical protein
MTTQPKFSHQTVERAIDARILEKIKWSIILVEGKYKIYHCPEWGKQAVCYGDFTSELAAIPVMEQLRDFAAMRAALEAAEAKTDEAQKGDTQ